MTVKRRRRKKLDTARSSVLSQRIDALVGFAGERTGNMASCDPKHVQADKWWLISSLVFWKDPASSSGSCSTQEPGLRGGCRGAPLLPRSNPFLRCSQHNNAGMITPFSPLNYPQECPGFKRKKKKKHLWVCRGVQPSGVLGFPAGEETSVWRWSWFARIN